MSGFRAQCASCMRVNEDPAALSCPACGSRRLVVLDGERVAAPKLVAKPAPPPIAPRPKAPPPPAAQVPPLALTTQPRPAAEAGPLRPGAAPRRGWGTAVLREVIACGCGELNMSDVDMARDLCLTREYVRQVRRQLGLPSKAKREALAAARRAKARPAASRLLPASPGGGDRPIARIVFDALLVSGSPHVQRLPDGSLSAPLDVAISALRRAAC